MLSSRRTFLRATVLGAVALAASGPRGALAAGSVALADPLEPAELARRLDEVAAGELVVLFVGPPDDPFEERHVPGARRLPHVGTEEGRRALTRALEATPKGVGVVVYCGCCPYERCPSVRPANALLRASRRADAWWLDLPTSFEANWVERGFPVAGG